MSANPNANSIRMTEDEYLAFEQESDIRHEYIKGEVVAMAGASQKHNDISMTLSYLLYAHVRGSDCRVYGSEMRVKIEKADLQTYPDFSAVCGEIDLTDDPVPALTNPILIIEILSPSTESYDRGAKFHAYQQLPTLQEYVLVSQDSARIESFYRKSEAVWELKNVMGLASDITLQSIACHLALADIYENVTFDEV